MAPYIVYALPRSRTFWLSRYLSYREWHCGHDELRHARSLDDVRSWLSQHCTGTVETAGAPYWRLAQQMCSDIRTVVVRRPVPDVVDSLMRLGLPFDQAKLSRQMRMLDAKLDQIEARVPGVLSVRFEDLDIECGRVFEHCLPYNADDGWDNALRPLNLQCSMPSMLRYYSANESQLIKLAKIAKHAMLAEITRGLQYETDGMTIAPEAFDDFYRDSQHLFASHLVEVGEAPDDFRRKNVDLMRNLDHLGMLQVVTARSNGRVFGYLMAIIGPSLESDDLTSALHTTFYASRDVPGLGMKLQRASIEALRQKGVGEVIFRAGERGDGPRMGSLYRRLGAADFGQLFRLDMTRH